ncbi:autotransporter outer membrane beta-barrel domain-containing protein [uncultured Helicobacter sp.]|uniref:autotransporter outer membrane beta-barrel domain-containing protein n=1 Tax=uncultured Helicobacter sp. TaxID=175537 RepID=UPI0026049017|nr:autotransporter outer membrane beta-barrel domain-containing protein [uncultured Helicobacter sp.]
MRVGISLALSALFAQVVCAEVCPTATAKAEDLTVNEGTTCEITNNKEVNQTVTNNGTIIFKNSGSGLKFTGTGTPSTITIGNGTTHGTIKVQGNATIDASKANGDGLKIEGQDISVDKNYALTLKATKITFGGNSGNNKFVTISGDSYVHSSTSYKNILLDTTTEITLKDLTLTNVRMSGSALTTLTNTKLTLNNSYITSDAELAIKGESNGSTFIVQKDSKNTISAKKITFNTTNATHTFQGEGIIDFQAGTITLGASSQTATLKQGAGEADKEGAGQTTVGFIADTQLKAENLSVEGIKMQVVKNSEATLSNIKSTFKGATLQALDRDDKDQVLVIENGNTDLTKAGKIDIATITINGNQQENTTTTFMGSGIKIYGQEITINGDSNGKSNTLSLQTIDDSGEITLGKKDSDAPVPSPFLSSVTGVKQDGRVTIKGTNTNKNLQLRGTSTIIGGDVSLESLSVQTHSKNEGMVFDIGSDGNLTLSKISLTSGIQDKNNQGNFQSLSFTSESQGTISVTSETTLKASEFAFTNQEITLSNGASGSTLDLYAMGQSSLSLNLGSGVGVFSFDNTTISNGSSAKLSLYSQDHAKITAYHLTLSGITLETYTIDKVKQNTKNAIDLSSTMNDLTIKGNVTIDTKKFLYGNTQGVGADITIIGDGSSGGLTLKAEENGSSFTFGGTVTLDNSSSGGATSLLSVQLGTNAIQNTMQNTNNSNVDLIFNGGLTAIGNASSTTTTTLTAKSFTFGAGSVVSSINGTLTFSANGGSNGIDISKGTTILQGLSSAEGKISKANGGALKLGDVFATGKTKIENATFVDSNLTIRSLNSSANTLTITSTNTPITGIQTIDIEDANLTITNGTQPSLKLNENATITSRGVSKIEASQITADSGTYDIKVQNGTLTIQETADAGDMLQSLTLGTKGKQGANFVFANNLSPSPPPPSPSYHDFEAPNITSYQNSTITANLFNFDTKGADISSSGGELKLIAKETKDNDLVIKHGQINLNDGGLSYYKDNGSSTLKNLKLHNGGSAVSITSQGDSFIEANELSLGGNTITSSGGFLTLKGVKDSSTFGNITVGDHGGLSAVKKTANVYEGTTIKVNSTSSLTLQANAPFTSSSYLLGGGKFGVLQAKTLEFEGNGGTSNPLIKIEILHDPIVGEELFTLREGKQIVVQTTEGIFKNSTNGQFQSSRQKTNITLEDISVAPTGYESLSLTAQLLDDKKTEITTEGGTAHSVQVTLKALQGTAWEKSESITDTTAKNQMQSLIKSGRNEEILDNILLSSNALKAGFSELIAQGDVVTVSNALNYISDAYTSLADGILLNDRIQSQLSQMQSLAITNRLTRGKNPHAGSEELARFIRSYHGTAYASSDDELPSEQSPQHKGELWVSYDGSMGTGNSATSLVNGVMIGYDYDISQDVLLGGLVQYGYGSFDGNFLHTTSHNVAFALYSRMYFGENELDISISQNFGFNTTNIQVGSTSMPQQINGAMSYDLYRTGVSATYGYRFAVGGSEEDSPYYLKPLLTLEGSYLYQEEGVSNSLVPLYVSVMHSFKAVAGVGLEMRKYFSVGNYFYLTPMVLRDLFCGGSNAEVGFVDTQKMTYTPNYTSKTSLSLQAGGEGRVGENLSINGGVGFKMGIENSELLTNWSVGLKYRF